MKYTDIEYLNVEPNDMYSDLTEKVINKCFETETLVDKNITISIFLQHQSIYKHIIKNIGI